MIKSSGFKTFRPRPSRYVRFRVWQGGLVDRQGWGVMSFPWANVSHTYIRSEIRAGNLLFRDSQRGWRSYMGKAPARRV